MGLVLPARRSRFLGDQQDISDPEAAVVVVCPECLRQARTEPLPIGIGMPLESGVTARLIREKYSGASAPPSTDHPRRSRAALTPELGTGSTEQEKRARVESHGPCTLDLCGLPPPPNRCQSASLDVAIQDGPQAHRTLE
jgi:hypothetical protein